MSTSSLPALHAAEEAFKNIVWRTLEDLSEAAFFARFPYFNWYPLNAILKWVFEQKADDTFDYAAMLMNLDYVPMKNAATQGVFREAVLSLQSMADQYGGKSEEYAQARIKNQRAFADHVRSLLVARSR